MEDIGGGFIMDDYVMERYVGASSIAKSQGQGTEMHRELELAPTMTAGHPIQEETK
jgi:hypothetical protein